MYFILIQSHGTFKLNSNQTFILAKEISILAKNNNNTSTAILTSGEIYTQNYSRNKRWFKAGVHLVKRGWLCYPWRQLVLGAEGNGLGNFPRHPGNKSAIGNYIMDILRDSDPSAAGILQFKPALLRTIQQTWALQVLWKHKLGWTREAGYSHSSGARICLLQLQPVFFHLLHIPKGGC